MRLIDADKIGLTDFEIISCNGDYKAALQILINKINEAPTIDAVPVVHGEWILITSPSILYKHYRCSECGEMVYNKRLYCSNCGDKMIG